jgi:hypothetical protein
MMPRLGRAATLACALAATGFSAAAQEGDIATGHTFAREAFKMCHVVEPEEEAPGTLDIAPAFRAIAPPRMTATALRVFLTSSPPKMPNLILKPGQAADVIAYILSLRDHP